MVAFCFLPWDQNNRKKENTEFEGTIIWNFFGANFIIIIIY